MTRWERAEVRPGAPKIYFNALALLWARGHGDEDDELLLVRQKGPGDSQDYSALPGGRIGRGELLTAGPDRLILDVAFVPGKEAIWRLAKIPWLIMREPLLAYLQGKAAPGCVWLYSQQGDGAPALIRRLQGPPAS
jgi:hypothetical protein